MATASIKLQVGSRNLTDGIIAAFQDTEQARSFITAVEEIAAFARIQVQQANVEGKEGGVFVFLSPKKVPLKKGDGSTVLMSFVPMHIIGLLKNDPVLPYSFQEVWEDRLVVQIA